jgi:DNA modification methylase
MHVGDARHMPALPADSVDLVVTSPPYPMIAMWDDLFAAQDPQIADHLAQARGLQAFEGMHGLLDPVWSEILRVLKPGGLACINVGDATRSLGDDFALYPNHARILQCLSAIGFTILPDILWRKPTNAPNKFMGSGMLPAGAYVTLEHEYILIARKGGKRVFVSAAEKQNRRASALFWEERNRFFSDVWTEVRGTAQVLPSNEARARSAAFPFEVAYRLIAMYSVKGDQVLDPFWGTGTTTAAAMALGRNSIGLEIAPVLADGLGALLDHLSERLNAYTEERLARHLWFVAERMKTGRHLRHRNKPYGFPVVTAQEVDLILNPVAAIEPIEADAAMVDYAAEPQAAFCGDWKDLPAAAEEGRASRDGPDERTPAPGQLKLF